MVIFLYLDLVIVLPFMIEIKFVSLEEPQVPLASLLSQIMSTLLVCKPESGIKSKVHSSYHSASGISPSARAAHGATCIETNKIIIYGGATGAGGGLASDDLFHLDLRDRVGVWNIINVSGRSPGKRYGHTMTFSKPNLIVFGGNVGDRTVNDCWLINIE